MISVIRIDDRLIHGQVIEGWVKHFNLEKIIIVDDQICRDPFQQRIMKIALLPGLIAEFVSLEEAVLAWSTWEAEEPLSILLVSHPDVILSLIEKGKPIRKVNVGCMHYEGGKEAVLKSVYWDEAEKKVFEILSSRGIEIEGKGIPTERGININKLLEGEALSGRGTDA
ncbi:MAG TPA: PTS sugar transporter subunit IIB [bacterium]|nr:PTS sugar transporter subunit IIB [bacterium]